MAEITATQISRERVTIELSDLEMRNIMRDNISTKDIIKELRNRIHDTIISDNAKIAWDMWSEANPGKNPFTHFVKPQWGNINESKATISRYEIGKTPVEVDLTDKQMKMIDAIRELEKTLEPKL